MVTLEEKIAQATEYNCEIMGMCNNRGYLSYYGEICIDGLHYGIADCKTLSLRKIKYLEYRLHMNIFRHKLSYKVNIDE